MTSKDKLIEFLKSANIEYSYSPTIYGNLLEFKGICFIFNNDGSYSMHSKE